MITTRFMELRKRRGLMIALIAVNIGIPVVFLAVRLISHAVDPKSYGPAGGYYDLHDSSVPGFMYIFGFIVAAVVGCTAGSVDLTEGMFRHLVITGRSRLALYLARIPAGLAIVISMVAVGYTIVCAVCVFAAPTQLNYDGVDRAAGALSPRLRQLGRRPCRRGDLQLQLQRSEPPAERALRQRQRSTQVPARSSRRRRGRLSPCMSTRGRDPDVRRHDGESELLGLPRHLLGPFDLVDDRCRPVDHARGDHRVHRRPRARLAHGTTDRPGHPPHRAGTDPDARSSAATSSRT